MATSDLLNELQNPNFKPDSDGERKIVQAVLRLLHDTSSDVQGLAAKCLPPLMHKVHQQQIANVLNKLADSAVADKSTQRDISAIGIRTIVHEADPHAGPMVANLLVAKLVKGVQHEDVELKLVAMEIMNDLFKRFGGHLSADETQLCQDALAAELSSVRPAIRKRAIQCISSLSVNMTEKVLAQLVSNIVGRMGESSVSLELSRTYVQTLSGILRAGGYRLGRQLEVVIPFLISMCKGESTCQDAEMIESCLFAFEAFVQCCRSNVGEYEEAIVSTSLHFLSYNPNYAMDDDDDDVDDCEDVDEDEEDGDDEDDEGYSDDDDVSWKVRRAATKVLSVSLYT